jgi:hypothetical protein
MYKENNKIHIFSLIVELECFGSGMFSVRGSLGKKNIICLENFHVKSILCSKLSDNRKNVASHET